MSIFDLFKQLDINQGVSQCKADQGAILLDVRTPQEYQQGHIPGSKNIPLQAMDKIVSVANCKDTPLYVYCYSGARSRQAVRKLQCMGYTDVTNIGGIANYSGKVEQ